MKGGVSFSERGYVQYIEKIRAKIQGQYPVGAI